jgi:hypothetical protein
MEWYILPLTFFILCLIRPLNFVQISGLKNPHGRRVKYVELRLPYDDSVYHCKVMGSINAIIFFTESSCRNVQEILSASSFCEHCKHVRWLSVSFLNFWLSSVCSHLLTLADISTLKMEAIRSSETSVHTRYSRLHIPKHGIQSNLSTGFYYLERVNLHILFWKIGRNVQTIVWEERLDLGKWKWRGPGESFVLTKVHNLYY